MIAKNIAPGLKRSFAFQSFRSYDPELFTRLKEEALTKQYEGTYHLFGFDKDPEVLAIAELNARVAGVADVIQWQQRDFSL